jgi:hypothetical protein
MAPGATGNHKFELKLLCTYVGMYLPFQIIYSCTFWNCNFKYLRKFSAQISPLPSRTLFLKHLKYFIIILYDFQAQ